MAICVLGDLAGMKRDLQLEEMPGDYNGLLGFANKHKLAILAWGSRGLWNPYLNYNELEKDQAKSIDKSFDLVAEAWERGVKELCEKYGLPNRNFLIWGVSGSAQWAARLCLRKPDYFLAIHVHVPSSFDKPTPEAAKVLWCLTTGEVETGYERSRRFVAECRPLGYPMVYKAIAGLGHASHPDATALGFKFFEFALTQKDLRNKFDQSKGDYTTNNKSESLLPWPTAFRNPPYYGDLVNQEVFSADQVDKIPENFRIRIPNSELATIWAKSR
jgi:predicted esterase